MLPMIPKEDAFLLRAQLAQSHNNEAKLEVYVMRLKRENDALRSEIRALRAGSDTEIIRKSDGS